MKFCLRKSSTSGFTLIEVLVSLSIFTFVTVAAVGVLLVMIDANQKAQNTQIAMTNLSLALDSMTRDIRTGTDYTCGSVGGSPSNCTSGSDTFGFSEGGVSLTDNCSPANDRIGYRLSSGVIERSLCGAWEPLTSGEVAITALDFVTTGAARTDTLAPTVTIFISGTVAGVRGSATDFSIQTTVTQQVLDI